MACINEYIKNLIGPFSPHSSVIENQYIYLIEMGLNVLDMLYES